MRVVLCTLLLVCCLPGSRPGTSLTIAGQGATLPDTPLTFGVFDAAFRADGTFSLEGSGWPSMKGTWRAEVAEVLLMMSDGPKGCDGPGRYRFNVEGRDVTFALVSDDCVPRRMILGQSTWVPRGTARVVPERRIVLTPAAARRPLPRAASAAGSWPSFRGPLASGVADGQRLPDKWDGATRENVLWQTPIPGLAHSSPVVWGDLIFVTSAVSGLGNATFKPGLYGDGDASEDRSTHKWMLFAIDKPTGKVKWERVAHEGPPAQKRHVKSTYASATPVTDGRIVVAWFGSQGIHAYDVDGRPLWKVDIGRIDLGAYDIPSFEWGPASSPILWNGLVIVQCDTQADSFVLALDAETGKTMWKTPREELPSWGTPTVAATSKGPELVTNASNFVRAYDPRSGRELWRIGGSSKITAPTPVFQDDLLVVASGRAPERPIFVVKAGSRGDLSLPSGQTSSEAVAWSRTGRGSYMPTPLIYQGLLYVLANNGVLDAYNLKTGHEVYRQRLPLVGSGFSASPVAADGKIYLSNEDGEMLVIGAGETFSHIATNSIGELLMATPALSEGVMYVRSVSSLFAIGRK
jgi:outer membrane protein assembly factor BamB